MDETYATVIGPAVKTITLDENLKIKYCVPEWVKNEQIKSNTTRVKARISAVYDLRLEPIALVNFGPSLNDTWEKIRDFRHIMTCSGAHKFLVERGIIPTHHIDVDPRPHKVALIGTPQKGTEYLIASTCSPALIELLKDYDLKLWHIFDTSEDGMRLLPPGEWSITGGCLHATAKVLTEDGYKEIKWLVENKYSGRVLSLEDNGCFGWRQVKGHSVLPNTAAKRWISLRGASKLNLILTEDHPCAVIDDPLDPRVYYIAAREAIGRYSVRKPEADRPPRGNDYALYNPEQLAVLYGTLMGDSTVAKDGRIGCDHGAAQLVYMELKQRILGGRVTSRSHSAEEWGGERLTYRWRQAANGQTRRLRELVYGTGRKTVSFLLKHLDERSLAFWYMDDGDLHRFADSRPLVELNTCGFSQEEHTEMADYFNSRWGLRAKVIPKRCRGKIQLILQFRVDDSEHFLRLVAPFIPAVMHYKVPEHLRVPALYAFDCRPLGYGARLVTKLTRLNSSWCKSKLYDIEVEGTHNFVANQTVVHNCSVGVRTLTLARFLGFTDLHVFGMDGSFATGGSTHAAEHPNKPKSDYILNFDGKQYHTTPAMLEATKNTWHELDMMKDVKVTFYGDGLCQAMARKYERKVVSKPVFIGLNKPELISAEYRDLNRRLHAENLAYGVGGGKHAATVIKLVESLSKKVRFPRVLDYGCGRSYLAKSLPFSIDEYDPAIPGKDEPPRAADLVVSTDVLEHIEPDKLDFVLDDIRRCTKQIAFLVIHTQPSSKFLANGRNSHLIIEGKDWWKSRLEKFFLVPRNGFTENPPILVAVVAPKKMNGMATHVTTEPKKGTNENS